MVRLSRQTKSPGPRFDLDSPGYVLQVGVDLVEPITICKLFSGSDVRGCFLSISQPAHFDQFRVEVIDAANQHGRMVTTRSHRGVKSD